MRDLDRIALQGINRELDFYKLAATTRSARSRIYKSDTIIKGEASGLLPPYKEAGTEEVEGVIHRKSISDTNTYEI